MQRISVNLKNYCDGNQINYNNDLPAIENKNYALQKPFGTDFLTVIGNAKLWSSFVIFYVKFFAPFILSWNSLKCFLWYLLEYSDPFINNEISVLPILIEKNLSNKIYFCLLKMKSIFFKEGKSNVSIKLGQIKLRLNFM